MPTDNLQSLSDYYRRTYFEWRMAYRLSDCCMHELVAAIRAEADRPGIDRQDALQLYKLGLMIEAELDIAHILSTERAA